MGGGDSYTRTVQRSRLRLGGPVEGEHEIGHGTEVANVAPVPSQVSLFAFAWVYLLLCVRFFKIVDTYHNIPSCRWTSVFGIVYLKIQ